MLFDTVCSYLERRQTIPPPTSELIFNINCSRPFFILTHPFYYWLIGYIFKLPKHKIYLSRIEKLVQFSNDAPACLRLANIPIMLK